MANFVNKFRECLKNLKHDFYMSDKDVKAHLRRRPRKMTQIIPRRINRPNFFRRKFKKLKPVPASVCRALVRDLSWSKEPVGIETPSGVKVYDKFIALCINFANG